MIRKRMEGGFTLLELLTAIGIVTCLAGLLLPTVDKMRSRAETVTCAANMRQIGIAALQYSAENNQKLPMIEPWPSQPNYAPEDNVKSIGEVLEPYG